MGGTGMFWTFLGAALLAPIVLLWVVRILARVLPPPINRILAVIQKNPAPYSELEAVLWSAWFVMSALEPDKSWDEWLFSGVAALFAAESIIRAKRERNQARREDLPGTVT